MSQEETVEEVLVRVLRKLVTEKGQGYYSPRQIYDLLKTEVNEPLISVKVISFLLHGFGFKRRLTPNGLEYLIREEEVKD